MVTAAPDAVPQGRIGLLVVLLTSAMAASMLLLFIVGSLGAFVIVDLGLSRYALGGLVSVAFGTAAVLSMYAGHVVDVIGGRKALCLLFGAVAFDFVLLSLAETYVALLLAFALGGVAQSLANPATNKLIGERVSVKRRGLVIGLKQSGVQMGALIAGLVLPSLATALGWRMAVRTVAVLPALALVVSLVTVSSAGVPAQRRAVARPGLPHGAVRWLMAYSFFMATGAAGMNSYLALYAHQSVGLSTRDSGFVLGVLGVAGGLSRVLWSGMGQRMRHSSDALIIVSAGAVGSALAVELASGLGSVLLWVGAVGLGASAVAAFAISMVVLLTEQGTGRAGHDSAMVSLGVFAGFVVGAPLFGVLVDATQGYTLAWLAVAAEFAAAGGVAALWRRSRRQEDPAGREPSPIVSGRRG